ncbi:MAG: YggS family pyridoxal phosphate-dependent enzyme [Ancrocorticia sp.]|uniref:YggS family pyridoxal phosphate-dependent enzyme n=1 Tax=Ancrocorticia sp. TaxID=2593684 RepID=UPI003F904EB9
MNLESVPSLEEISGRYAHLQDTVSEAVSNAGRNPQDVSIELAAKYQAPERILAALNAGSTLLGHNIIQQLEEAEQSLAASGAPAHRTHVIGHVQKNKAGRALAYAQCIETVDSSKLARRLDRLQGERVASGQADGPFDVMIQVNSSGAESQYGRSPESVLDFAGKIQGLENLRLTGLMTIGAHTSETSAIARSFEIVRELRDEIREAGIASATELSMGMTHDMEIAIAEGSTIIRVGTAVFGPRQI